MISIDEINRLKAENDKLKECNAELTSDNLNTIQEMDNERRRVEQLKEENERLNDIIDSYQPRLEELKELKSENEKLKEDYIKLCQQKDLDNVRWQKRCTDLHVEDKAKADKYWLALQEIKAIAEENKDTVQYGGICRSILMEIIKAEEE